MFAANGDRGGEESVIRVMVQPTCHSAYVSINPKPNLIVSAIMGTLFPLSLVELLGKPLVNSNQAGWHRPRKSGRVEWSEAGPALDIPK